MMSKLKPCKSCGQEVAKSAKVCPKCGQKLKMGMIGKIGVFFVVLVVVAMVAQKKEGSSGAGSQDAAAVSHDVYEVVQTPKFAVSVDYWFERDSVGSAYVQEKASSGGKYIAVIWRYKNTTNEPLSAFDKPRVYLMSPDGVTYEADIGASSALTTEDAIAKLVSEKVVSKLNPGISSSAADVFEVAETSFDPNTWKVFFKAGREKVYFSMGGAPKLALTKEENERVSKAVAAQNAKDAERQKMLDDIRAQQAAEQ